MTDKVIPNSHLDLFKKKAFAHLATVMPDGKPQVTPIWVDYDGHNVVFNTAEGRQKDKNLQRDARVAMSILDPDNPYRYLEVRGVVDSITPDPEGAFYRELALRYGRDRGSAPSDAPHRVILQVTINHATWM